MLPIVEMYEALGRLVGVSRVPNGALVAILEAAEGLPDDTVVSRKRVGSAAKEFCNEETPYGDA